MKSVANENEKSRRCWSNLSLITEFENHVFCTWLKFFLRSNQICKNLSSQRMYWKEVTIAVSLRLFLRTIVDLKWLNQRQGFIDPSKTESIIIHLFFFQAENGQKLSWKYFRQLCDYCSKTACCASCSNRPNQIMVVVVARPQSSISKKTKTSRGKKNPMLLWQ